MIASCIVSHWNCILDNFPYYLYFIDQTGLTKLESLNLDSCSIKDEGMVHLAGYIIACFLFLIYVPKKVSLHFCCFTLGARWLGKLAPDTFIYRSLSLLDHLVISFFWCLMLRLISSEVLGVVWHWSWKQWIAPSFWLEAVINMHIVGNNYILDNMKNSRCFLLLLDILFLQ